MHDIRSLRDNPESYRKALARKGFEAPVEELLALDEQWRQLTQRGDELKAELNQASRAIGEAKKAGRDAAEEMEQARNLREEAANADERKRELREQIDNQLLTWPALPADEVPDGADESDNVLIRETRFEEEADFQRRDHLELAESLGILDMERGAKIAGSAFPLHVGQGARLERALINFMLDLQTGEHGYLEHHVPYLVNQQTATGTGQLPKFEEDLYRVERDGFYLIPTSEVPLTNIHAGEILSSDILPLKLTAFSANFRREAGAHGADTRGLLRVHQFNKVELVQIVEPEKSSEAQQQILEHALEVLRRLELTHRIIELCSGDLSFGAARCFDIELLSEATGSWLEVSSVSDFRDFQSRRMNLRYRPEGGGKPLYPHTLNGSGVATPRLMVALLEKYQTPEGRVIVPPALRPYMGGLEQIDGSKA